MGRPAQAYDEKGELVWQVEFDIYGRIREDIFNNKLFIPFRQLGQYEDKELDGLYYNRFRYYSSQTGSYISKDPIGLEGNNPNLYAYTFDSNSEVDPFGLMAQPEGSPYKIDINGKWHDSKGRYTGFSWSSNDGFDGSKSKVTLGKGTMVDRYGGWFEGGKFKDKGRFLSDAGVPFTERALPPLKNGTILTTYQVKKPFDVEAGKIAPWFGEKGGATQYFTKDKTIGELIDSGHLEKVKQEVICK